MEQPALNPKLVGCPQCGERERIGIHSHRARRYICHRCRKTFADSRGTALYGLHYPHWVVIWVLTL